MPVRGKADEESYPRGDRKRNERAVLYFVGKAPQGIVSELRRFVAELDGFAADRAGTTTKSIADIAQCRGDGVADTVGGLHCAGGSTPARALQVLLERAQPTFDFANVRGNRAGIS